MKKPIKLFIFLFLPFAICHLPASPAWLGGPFALAFAQDLPINFEDISPETAHQTSLENESQEIELFVNESKILDKKAKRVAVGNPEVADVRVISDKEIMLLGKSTGKTNLIIWDKFDQREVLSLQVLAPDPQRLVNYLNEIIKAAGMERVKAIAKGEKIILAGSVSNPAEMEQLNNLTEKIEGLINVVRIVLPSQKKPELIQIDVEVLEISKSALREMGVAWSETFRFGEIAGLTPKEDWLNTFSQLTPGLIKIGRWQHSAVAAKLSLLFEEGKARLLAHPKLVTNSGKQANFLAGGEIPIQVSGENPHIEWKPYGISLEIEPTVVFEDSINTKLQTEVSSLDWAYATQSGGNTPAVKTRSTQTEVNIEQGDTLLIAGLIQNEEAKNLQKFPILGDIPILGELFKSTRFQNDQTELVIFVTPTIISVEERRKKIEQEERKAKEEKETEEMLTLRGEMKERLTALRQGEQAAREAEEEARKKREELLALMRRIEELGKENERQAKAIRESLSAKRTKQEENLQEINRRIREKLEKKVILFKKDMEEAKRDEAAAIQKRKEIESSIQQLERQIEGKPAKIKYQKSKIKKRKATEEKRKIEWAAASKRDYARKIQRKISKFITRPRGMEDLEGTVVLKLHLFSNGRLKDLKVIKSSGRSALDRAALSGVRKASPYWPFPLGVEEKSIWLKLPVSFKKVERKEIEKKRREAKLRRLKEQKKREQERIREKELRELEKKQQEITSQLEKEKRKKELEKLREELRRKREEARIKKETELRRKTEERERQKKIAELKRLAEEKKKLETKKRRAEEIRNKIEQERKQRELQKKKRAEKRILAKYIPQLQEQIRQASAYLPEVKSDKDIKQATAVLSIHIFSDGNMDEISIKKPSEFSLFDNALVQAVKRGFPYLPFPRGIERKRLRIEIPITYKRAYPIAAEEKIEKEREMSKLLDKIEKGKLDYFNKGKKYYQMKEYESAMEAFAKVSPPDPNYKKAQKYIILCQKKWEAQEKREFEKLCPKR